MTVTEPTVHIVDDDTSFLTAMSRLLRSSGFAVKTFSSASEFLAQRDIDAPGCVVADLRMPGLNGLDLQAALVQSSNPLPLLFLTGHGDIASTVSAMRAGAEDFLEKRAPKEELLLALKRALARDAREREARARQRAVRARFVAGALARRPTAVAARPHRGDRRHAPRHRVRPRRRPARDRGGHRPVPRRGAGRRRRGRRRRRRAGPGARRPQPRGTLISAALVGRPRSLRSLVT